MLLCGLCNRLKKKNIKSKKLDPIPHKVPRGIKGQRFGQKRKKKTWKEKKQTTSM